MRGELTPPAKSTRWRRFAPYSAPGQENWGNGNDCHGSHYSTRSAVAAGRTVGRLQLAAIADLGRDHLRCRAGRQSGSCGSSLADRRALLSAGGHGRFRDGRLFQLHDKEAAILGQNLLDRQELPLAPGTSQTVAFAAKPGILSLGVAASYRNVDRAQWRGDAPVAEGKKTKLKVQLDKLTLSIMPDAK
jgi:hypothetical protein